MHNLKKRYGLSNELAVNGISFGVRNGECFALLGVNGAGKTTTFKMLCGQFTPSFGTIFLDKFDITKNHNDLRKA